MSWSIACVVRWRCWSRPKVVWSASTGCSEPRCVRSFSAVPSDAKRVDTSDGQQDHFRAYIDLVDRYEIIPEEKRSAFAGPQHATQNPSVRREHKIAQFKIEKETKSKLEVRLQRSTAIERGLTFLGVPSKELRKRRQERRPKVQASTSTATTLSAPVEELDDLAYDSDEEDDYSRDLHLTLLQLHYLRAHAELSSMEQELELLNHGMKMSEIPSGRSDKREEGREAEDEGSWRVENLQNAEGPLLDPKGKVLRPFTILPSNSSSALNTRLRLQSEVFRPSHRLPTMTIDEFLDAEREAGNILQGGGPNSSEAVEEARRQEKGEKEEDNVRGWEAEEKELKKTREWDEYRDTHRKGEGNM